MLQQIKKKLHAYLMHLAEENEKQFGNERLDCCTMNVSKDDEIEKIQDASREQESEEHKD